MDSILLASFLQGVFGIIIGTIVLSVLFFVFSAFKDTVTGERNDNFSGYIAAAFVFMVIMVLATCSK